jgi:hypothetical protein
VSARIEGVEVARPYFGKEISVQGFVPLFFNGGVDGRKVAQCFKMIARGSGYQNPDVTAKAEEVI